MTRLKFFRIPIDRRAWPIAMTLIGLMLLSMVIFPIFILDEFILALILFFHLAFFRDPERQIPTGNTLLSPADGTIVDISTCDEPRFLQETSVKIAIFLSLFNVHITRAPEAGVIRYLKYEPGKFVNVLKIKSVDANESNWIGFEEKNRRFLVRQMAGMIARRIHCDAKMGDETVRGERIGVICYGSRVECYVPKRLFRANVQIGANVKAGLSALGEWAS